jgi:polysaccharide biosynthesis/export protein
MSTHLKLAGVALAAALGGWSFIAVAQSANTKSTEAVNKEVEKNKSQPNVSPDYVVGESDVLHINVWKEQEISQTVTVRTDGNISLPLINEVRVSGMTPLQIQNLIAEKLKAYLTNPQVTVTVTDIRSKRAFITGEIARPGSYALNAETNVLQLIAQAGGFTPFAKRENIFILRFEDGQQRKLPFRYKDVVHGKNTSQNISLRPGDTVVVP